MIYFLALLPATMLTIAGYVVMFLAARSEGGLKSFGKYLGFWAFTLAALVMLGAIFAAASHHGHRGWMHGGHAGMHGPWPGGPPPWAGLEPDQPPPPRAPEQAEPQPGPAPPANAPAPDKATPPAR